MSGVQFLELALVGTCIGLCLSPSDKVEGSFRSVPRQDVSSERTLERDTCTGAQSIVASHHH